ncbi:MAG TPA: elongation factor P [bacterium]|nr:elongation factor P [bacterium]
MKDATEVRTGNVVRVDQKICKVMSQEIRGTGKFGKTVHVKLKNLQDGNVIEKSWRAEDRVEDLELERVKMQYLYREGDQFVFMNMQTYEQLPLAAKTVGKQEVFLKENMEIDVEIVEGKPLSIAYPKIVELKVVNAPPPVKGGSDSTYKEVELENGLMILVPQFIKEGESVRIDVENLSYLERVTVKSMATEQRPKEKE